MRRLAPKFEKPLKPWDSARSESERKIMKAYGLRRKHEIWRAESILRTFRRIARELQAKKDKAKEEMLLNRLKKTGLISADGTLDDVLNLEINDILERRLQTLVYKKGLANSLRQSRQFIVHGHISVNSRRTKWPSMIVDKKNDIRFYEKSKVKSEKIEE